MTARTVGSLTAADLGATVIIDGNAGVLKVISHTRYDHGGLQCDLFRTGVGRARTGWDELPPETRCEVTP